MIEAHDLERNPAYTPPSAVVDIAAEGPAAPVFRISPPEPWRLVRTRERAADPEMRKRLPATELVATGFFTSATGVTVYRGSAYPEAYRGNAFVGDVGGNLVHRKTLSVQGATYLATRADTNVEFLASTDNWFRPVNFANTPDGTLLILDMYRETIEHPWSIPEPIKKHLDLTSGKDRGRLYTLVFDAAPDQHRRRPRMARAPTADLVSLLADPDAWWRETAQRLLIERRDASAVPLLKELVARRPTALGRLHALWTLDILGDLPTALLAMGLHDPEARVREPAVRLAERKIAHDPDLLAAVLPMADDPDSMVRFQVALTLGEASGDRRTFEALGSLAMRDAGDPWTRTAVLSSVGKGAPVLIEILAGKNHFLDTPSGQLWLDELATLIGAGHDPVQIRRLVALSVGARHESDLKLRVVVGVNRGARRSGTSVSEILQSDWAKLSNPLGVQAMEIALSNAPPDRRLFAIAFLGISGAPRALDALGSLLDARQPAAVQLAALQALGQGNDPAVGGLVVSHWKAMSPGVRREATELLFSRRDRLEHLIGALESGRLAAAEIDSDRLKQLRTYKDAPLRARAIRIIDKAVVTSQDRKATLEAFQGALTLAGRPEQGHAVYLKVCATCHRLLGEGVEVGPDLATVAGRPADNLLLHILDPNREVVANYVNYNVATTDGRTISGIIAAESATALTLKHAQGVMDVVPRSQIEVIASTGLSLMPEGLEKGESPQDLADLIAFLKSVTATTGGPPRPGSR